MLGGRLLETKQKNGRGRLRNLSMIAYERGFETVFDFA